MVLSSGNSGASNGSDANDAVDMEAVEKFLVQLQDDICSALTSVDGSHGFHQDLIETESGGWARPRVLEGGPVLEKAAVNFSRTVGKSLPASATLRRPELSGKNFEAASVSLIIHPRNPFAPTAHANFRCFYSYSEEGPSAWWFGGGFDLTPYYGFEEDARHWHRQARDACLAHGEDLYPRLKKQCDEYFYLPHRQEPRGIGGVFFDDENWGSFSETWAFAKSIAMAFLPAYLPILNRRKGTPFGEREKSFQSYRRGRYVEFNLVYDRGTKFGLQAGARTESVLASMPPEACWRYDWTPDAGSPEAELYEKFLIPREWVD